jgi:hypothetical protein
MFTQNLQTTTVPLEQSVESLQIIPTLLQTYPTSPLDLQVFVRMCGAGSLQSDVFYLRHSGLPGPPLASEEISAEPQQRQQRPTSLSSNQSDEEKRGARYSLSSAERKRNYSPGHNVLTIELQMVPKKES